MIDKFVRVFMDHKDDLEQEIQITQEEGLTYSYGQLVTRLVNLLHDNANWDDGPWPDPERITIIGDGDWAGARVYIIGQTGYQPRTYWALSVEYGSCSLCDTIQSIWDTPDKDLRTKDYVQLMLHMIQNIKQI